MTAVTEKLSTVIPNKTFKQLIVIKNKLAQAYYFLC